MLVIEHDDRGKVVCDTDQQCQWAYGPILAAELYDGEAYDAREQLTEGTSWKVVKCQPIADNLVAPDGPPVRRTQEVSPCEMFKSPSGKTIIDLGQNIVGWIRVRVDGPSGTTIQFQFAEVLEEGEVATETHLYCQGMDRLHGSQSSHFMASLYSDRQLARWTQPRRHHGHCGPYGYAENWLLLLLTSSSQQAPRKRNLVNAREFSQCTNGLPAA
ncbi:hypothetical protein V1506DRAFT_99218 [Lipomyces tetrasporus]